MADSFKPWYLRPPAGRRNFRIAPWKRLWLLLVAAFLLFSVFGFYYDLMSLGTTPYAVAAAYAFYSGLNAALWIIVVYRLPAIALPVMIAVQLLNAKVLTLISQQMGREFSLAPVPSEQGTHFAATCIIFVMIASYVFFIAYIRAEGKEAFRLHTELELAHGIQKTLVPPVVLRTAAFEVYGVSYPSHKVGGDLVDALLLPNGDLVAYVADIAGHGLPAGILMGMLKTAPRTVLLDAADGQPETTLPELMEKLNRILPEVKEPQMYATLTAFRLNADGSAWYAMAASPPVLHWSLQTQSAALVEEKQFPLGLLPVSGFSGERMMVAAGDVIVVATDGVLEVCDPKEQEYGVEPLKRIVEENGRGPLEQLAERILSSVRNFGKQSDDQTLLLIRRL